MEVAFGPNSVDEPNLLYKLQRKIKVFNTTSPLSNRGYNLVASSSKYAIVFVASPDGVLSAYHLRDLIDKDCEAQHLMIQLQEKPTHIATSCDHELLAVTGGQLLCIFKITELANMKCTPALVIRCEVNPSTFVSGLQWNPCIPDTIAIAFFDGTLLMAQVSNSQVKKVPSKARCICWSPKGKQLVTGNSDGTLSQYKPDLTPAKTIPAPNLFANSPVEAMAVYWISTFQFAVVYKNATDNSRPAVTIINTPKGGQPSCLNYEDICYSMGSNRPWYYYLQGLAQWNMIMSASSNGMEIATLGSSDGANWYQWCQTDEARPELPLTDKKIENFPVGICIDTCAIHQLPWGENSTLPFMPLLHVVSQSGLLTIFNIINKAGAQICSPPQQLILPPAALSSNIPGEAPPQAAPAPAPSPAAAPVPAPAPAPAPVPVAQPKPQNVQPAPPAHPQAAPPPQYTALNIPKPNIPQQPNQGFTGERIQPEQKPTVEIKPTPPAQTQRPVQIPALQQPVPQQATVTPTAQQAQENAALKAEQERKNEMKVNDELKKMLIKEVNDFQNELYNFMIKTRQTQTKLQRDIESINANFTSNSMTAEQLKKECSLDELRGAIMQLKLELVRACAVVAEARTHAEAKDYHQWTQADPLTAKRVASVKNLAYYVQTQLEQAQKSLDYKWSEARDASLKSSRGRMIRPILDDVYQPLVKQQEILSRQQAVLRTLRNALNECDITPMFKSTSLLRSTPFKNKDPLSKLTKNILNMSIEPTKTKEPLLTSQKLDALRDMLLDHKTVKIKPVNVEIREHLATMKKNYEKSLKEKSEKLIKNEPVVKTESKPVIVPEMPKAKGTPNFGAIPDLKNQSPINVPTFTPVGGIKTAGLKTTVSGLSNVARTLFEDKPIPDLPKATSTPQAGQMPPPKPHPAFGFSNQPASTTTRSVLKDLLQSKQANIEIKNEANTFMGQTICSPTSFAPSTTMSSLTPAPSAVFTSKPISDLNNMFNKFQPQAFDSKPAFGTENKPITSFGEVKVLGTTVPNPKSSETGEQITNLFAMKPSTPTVVPDVLKSTQEVKTDIKPAPKPVDKEKSKENVPDNVEVKVVQKTTEKKETPKPLQVTNKTSVFSQPTVTSTSNLTSSETPKPVDAKTEAKVESPKVLEKSETTATPSSVFSSTSPITVPKSTTSETTTSKTETPQLTEASQKTVASSKSVFASASSAALETAASIFGSAVASQPKTTSQPSQASSIFSAAVSSSPSSVFGSKEGSIFGSSSSVFGTTTSVETTKPSIFSTPTPPSPSTPVSSTPSSVFGLATPTTNQAGSFSSTQSSLFATTSTTSATSSIFGSQVPSTTSSGFGASTTTTQSIFATATSTSPKTIFGGETTITPSAFTPTTTQSPVFGNATSTAQSIFAAAATTKPAFGGSGSSVFGTPAGNQSPSSVFGSSTQASVFGNAAATTQSSVFGATTPTTQASVFGASTPTTQASVFGAATPSTPSSVFGAASSTQPSVFGTPSSTTQASVFGTVTTTTQASIFGAAAPSTQASVFGAATSTTQASVFGGATPSTQSSVFGATTPTTQASIFGSVPTTQTSVFGSAPATVFGSPPATTTQSSSLFGGAEASLFASASISTTNAPSQTSGGSIFGGSASGSVFGGGTNVFGGKAAFGQPNPTAASIFGGGGATSFGSQKPATSFWSGGNANAESGFGSPGFGQQPTTQASSIFGSTGGSFSTPAPAGQAFGSPQQSAFGSPQQQGGASPGAFGGAPSFGAKPAFSQPPGFGSPTSGGFGSTFGGFNKSPNSGFGAPAAFGSGASFGGAPAFGSTSPSQAFGGSPQPTGFGTPQSNSTFESLATQNTLTFGNLAQQSGQAPQSAPSFNTSPSFTGWRG